MARLAFEEGLCIERGNRRELDLVLRSGVPAGRVIMHGNNKSATELERAIDVGSTDWSWTTSKRLACWRRWWTRHRRSTASFA